jgi:serine/threonine protein kinase/tetratricopeptide (TPR) repeat protein
MPPASLQRIKTIFMEASEIAAGQRNAFLEEACGNDSELRTEVKVLLSAAERAGDCLFLSGATLGAATGPIPPSTALPSQDAGAMIGPYRLLEKIGEGGFGVVYVAEQKTPVRRRIALKIIKLGMDTRAVIARFEAERQALAMMDHPNIARVLDAGATDAGRPYFVMELVNGVSILRYCDENRLSPEQRLDLFVLVCNAIQHAHQKGIIHRDIKPSNIMVTLHDGLPVPKVIDFGIDKATQTSLTDKTIYTQFQHFIGTPAYISPEQAEMSGLDVDTRSDIYSLGVLLYELLTGTTPFDASALMESGLEAMRRTIRETPPPRPSHRVAELTKADSTTTAELRGLDHHRLISRLRGDLDWIVMKSLEKDRSRRYQTARDLAVDVQRHLTNEPILARPPSGVYRLGKFVRRNKLACFGGLFIAASLVGGLGTSTWMFSQERQARNRAVAAENVQSQLRKDAERNERTAREEAAKSAQIAQFLKDMLTGVGPSVAMGRDTTILREILDKTAQRVGTELEDQPEVKADLLSTIADVFRELGDYPRAESIFRQRLSFLETLEGNQTLSVALAREDLADVLRLQRKFLEAEPLARDVIATEIRWEGHDGADLVDVLSNLAFILGEEDRPAEEVALYREALRITQKLHNGNDAATVRALNNLGMALRDQGNLPEAEVTLRQAVAMQRQLPESLDNLGQILHDEGKIEQAGEMYRQALAIKRSELGNEHPEVASALDKYGQFCRDQGKFQDAEKALLEAFHIRRGILGDDHVYTCGSLGNLLSVLVAEGKNSTAEELLDQILPPGITNGPIHKGFLRDRGTFWACIGRFHEASADFSTAAPLSPDEYYIQMQLGLVLLEAGDLAGYRNFRRAFLTRFGAEVEPDVTGWIAYSCLLIPLEGSDLESAARLADRAVSHLVDNPTLGRGIEDADAAVAKFAKALSEYRQGHFGTAAEWAEKSLARAGLDSPGKVAADSVLTMALCQMNRTAEAQLAFRQANEIVATKFPALDCGYRYWHFHDPLMAEILLREAKLLINVSPSGTPRLPAEVQGSRPSRPKSLE